MVKKKLLDKGDGDSEFFVEKTPKGNLYYETSQFYDPDDPHSPQLEKVSKKEMRGVILQDLHAYGYIINDHSFITDAVQAKEDYRRVVDLAPELLPKKFHLFDSKNSLAIKIKNPSSFCPPGYKFVSSESSNKKIVKAKHIFKGTCIMLPNLIEKQKKR